jgi:hypothetical protein
MELSKTELKPEGQKRIYQRKKAMKRELNEQPAGITAPFGLSSKFSAKMPTIKRFRSLTISTRVYLMKKRSIVKSW